MPDNQSWTIKYYTPTDDKWTTIVVTSIRQLRDWINNWLYNPLTASFVSFELVQ